MSTDLPAPSITSHILTIPHPLHPYFLTQIVHLRSPTSQHSLFVHCTSISPTLAQSLTTSSSTAEDEDEELQAALIAAGRASTFTSAAGRLAGDFSLAMSHPTGSTGIPVLTSTTTSLSTSMGTRLAKKLPLSQLLLSLDLPPALVATPGRIQSPDDTRALLALEKALREACSSTLNGTAVQT